MKETKIVCPKCGTEMQIPEHGYASSGIVIDKDSGLGTIVLQEAETPVTKAQKRLETLKQAGVDVSGLFAMQTGDIARLDNGIVSVLPENDPIFKSIMEGGTIPDRHLFRRWVMAQMFHLLVGNFTENLRNKGYEYQWHVIEDELKVQVKLYNNDSEDFVERNKWFNKTTVLKMCWHYDKRLFMHLNYLVNNKFKKCKGIPYIRVNGKNIFVADVKKKLHAPIYYAITKIQQAETPFELYSAYIKFRKAYIKVGYSDMNTYFIDSFKGVGAFYTMKNLILFHECCFVDENNKRMTQQQSLSYLSDRSNQYAIHHEGWRLFGVMKKLLKDNNIDIKKKMAEWRDK